VGRRNYSAYTDDDWRLASASSRQILSSGWPVYADCDLCDVWLKVDIERVAQITGASSQPVGGETALPLGGMPRPGDLLSRSARGVTLAHPHLHQLEPEIRHAVLGIIGTLVAFRVGPEDVPIFTRELHPVLDVEDVLNLPNWHFYVKLMIDRTPCRAFSARNRALMQGLVATNL
jgi:hypothetical protein